MLFYMQGVLLAVCFFCWTLYSFNVVYSTLQMVIFLFFTYMQGVFLAVCISVGLCPQIMWCTPRYRGISSCFNLCGQLIRRFLASTLLFTGFSCPIYFMILFGCVLSSGFYPISYWDSFSRVDKHFSGTL